MTLYQQIAKQLQAQANPAQVKKDKYFHKYDGYKSLGLTMPALRKIIANYRTQTNDLTCADILRLSAKLYGSDIEEQILFANSVLSKRINCLQSVSFINTTIGDHLHTWSATDDFCSKILQPQLTQQPNKILPLLRRWNKSKNIWKRRASVIAFTRKVGESGRFTKEALALCDNLLSDKEDLIQKAVGWTLKDLMRGDKQIVKDYVKKLRRQEASATITLYAIRNLANQEKQEIIAIEPQ